jgi:hypothetical protein
MNLQGKAKKRRQDLHGLPGQQYPSMEKHGNKQQKVKK